MTTIAKNSDLVSKKKQKQKQKTFSVSTRHNADYFVITWGLLFSNWPTSFKDIFQSRSIRYCFYLHVKINYY